MRKPMVLSSLVLSAAMAASAVGVATSASPPGTKANPIKATTSVTKGFAPKRVTVKPGARVYFKNVDKARHSAVEQTFGKRPAFSSGAPTTKNFTLKAPAKPGSYTYICAVHGFMNGTLVVRR